MRKITGKWLLGILSIAMTFVFFPSKVIAEGEATNVAKVGETEYTSVFDAITDANADTVNKTVDLLTDASYDTSISISSSEVTINLNGHTLTYTGGDSALSITAEGNLTINGGSGTTDTTLNGTFRSDSVACLINIVNGGRLQLNYGNYETTNGNVNSGLFFLTAGDVGKSSYVDLNHITAAVTTSKVLISSGSPKSCITINGGTYTGSGRLIHLISTIKSSDTSGVPLILNVFGGANLSTTITDSSINSAIHLSGDAISANFSNCKILMTKNITRSYDNSDDCALRLGDELTANFGDGCDIECTSTQGIKASAVNLNFTGSSSVKGKTNSVWTKGLYVKNSAYSCGNLTVALGSSKFYGDFITEAWGHLHVSGGTYTFNEQVQTGETFDINIVTPSDTEISLTSEKKECKVHNLTGQVIYVNGQEIPDSDGLGGDVDEHGSWALSLAASPLCDATEETTQSTSTETSDWTPSYDVILRDPSGAIISEQWVAEGQPAEIPDGYTFDLEELYWVYRNLDVTAVSGPTQNNSYQLVNTKA